MTKKFIYYLSLAAALAGCGSLPPSSPEKPAERAAAPLSAKAQDVVLYAFSLIDTGYRFGGKNPEAGLDCSGMVSYIYGQAAGLKVSGSAADIARNGRPVPRQGLKPGDLVFFNTMNRSYSHVGIYIGDNRFVHAPATNGRIRIDSLGARYYAERFEAARSYFD
jgi:cell wall-associated NlpC family hydrolase